MKLVFENHRWRIRDVCGLSQETLVSSNQWQSRVSTIFQVKSKFCLLAFSEAEEISATPMKPKRIESNDNDSVPRQIPPFQCPTSKTHPLCFASFLGQFESQRTRWTWRYAFRLPLGRVICKYRFTVRWALSEGIPARYCEITGLQPSTIPHAGLGMFATKSSGKTR